MSRIKEGTTTRRGKEVGFYQAVDLPTKMKRGNMYTYEIGNIPEERMAFQKAEAERRMESILGGESKTGTLL